MIKQKTYEKFFEAYLTIEKKYNLLYFKIDGIYIFQFIRALLFEEILVEGNIISEPHTKINKTKGKLKILPKYLISSLLKNPFYIPTITNYLIFEHPRKIKYNDNYCDIYTKYIRDELTSNGNSIASISERYLGRQFNWSSGYYHNDILIILSQVYQKFTHYKLSKNEVQFIQKIQNEILSVFEVEINLKKIIYKYLKIFKIYYSFYKKLFKKLNLKKIYLVVSYGLMSPIIQAAKEIKVPVYEIQHGMISNNHIGYSFPFCKKNSLYYFPDYILIWDSFWKNKDYFPITEERLIVTDKTFISQESKKNPPNKKNKSILIVSQGSIGPELAKIMYNNLLFLSKFNIIYKLHPGEYNRYKNYNFMSEIQKQDNIKIISDNEKPLYKLLAESEIVVGVNSTVLYEALFFNCKVFILNLEGWRALIDFIELGKMIFLENNNLMEILR